MDIKDFIKKPVVSVSKKTLNILIINIIVLKTLLNLLY